MRLRYTRDISMFPAQRYTVLLATSAFVVTLGLMVAVTVHSTNGLFVYPLDDSYIHLALARTLATTGTWGLYPGEFASASSSPGWTILLAVIAKIAGTHLLTPLILNLLFGIMLCVVLEYGLRLVRPQSSPLFRALSLLLILFAAPITNLAFIGMEHVAQTLSMLLLVLFAAQVLILPCDKFPRTRLLFALIAAAFFAGALRYEAVFGILPIVVLLLVRRRFAVAVLVSAAAATIPVVFGLFSYRHSGLWLPFSVMMKASINRPSGGTWMARLWEQTSGGTFRPALLLPLVLLAFRWRPQRGLWSLSQLILLLSAVITALHLAFAPTRWLMRYDAYFMALFLFASLCALPDLGGQQSVRDRFLTLPRNRQILLSLAALLGLAIAPFLGYRVAVGVVRGPMASFDRFQEHIQMAWFVARFFDHDSIVVNDVGAVTFYSHAHFLDAVGLASERPARLLHEGHSMTPQDLAAWAKSEKASIAILQTDWGYIQRLMPPPGWIAVGKWKLARNVVFADRTVGFYATDRESLPKICHALQHFTLPPGVTFLGAPGVCPVNSAP